MVIPKIKGTCEHCTHPDLDPTSVKCVENYRMAGGCECTCNVMGFAACPVFEPIEDCSCTDGTTAPAQIIESVWIGFGDASVGKTLADFASLTCPDDPRVTYRLFGFGPGEWTDGATSGGTPLLWDGVNLELFDIPANPLAVCTGGVAQIPATDFNLSIVPVTGGTGTDCTQVGGYPVLAVEASNQCGKVLVFCPFVGVVGEEFACATACCTYSITQSSSPDPNTLRLIFTLTMDCVNAVSSEVRIGTTLGVGGSGPFPIFDGAMIDYDYTALCSGPGGSANVEYTVTNTYSPAATECVSGDTIFNATLLPCT